MMSGLAWSWIRNSSSVSTRRQRAVKPARLSSRATISKSSTLSSKIRANREIGTARLDTSLLSETVAKSSVPENESALPQSVARKGYSFLVNTYHLQNFQGGADSAIRRL